MAIYPYSIPSLQEKHQHLPDVVNEVPLSNGLLQGDLEAQIAQLTKLVVDNHNSLREDLLLNRTEQRNMIIKLDNRAHPDDVPHPVGKITPGSGIDLVHQVWGVVDLPAQQQLTNYFQATPVGPVGSMPPDFNGNADVLGHPDILKLVYWYNNLMGINPQDVL